MLKLPNQYLYFKKGSSHSIAVWKESLVMTSPVRIIPQHCSSVQHFSVFQLSVLFFQPTNVLLLITLFSDTAGSCFPLYATLSPIRKKYMKRGINEKSSGQKQANNSCSFNEYGESKVCDASNKSIHSFHIQHSYMSPLQVFAVNTAVLL